MLADDTHLNPAITNDSGKPINNRSNEDVERGGNAFPIHRQLTAGQ